MRKRERIKKARRQQPTAAEDYRKAIWILKASYWPQGNCWMRTLISVAEEEEIRLFKKKKKKTPKRAIYVKQLKQFKWVSCKIGTNELIARGENAFYWSSFLLLFCIMCRMYTFFFFLIHKKWLFSLFTWHGHKIGRRCIRLSFFFVIENWLNKQKS